MNNRHAAVLAFAGAALILYHFRPVERPSLKTAAAQTSTTDAAVNAAPPSSLAQEPVENLNAPQSAPVAAGSPQAVAHFRGEAALSSVQQIYSCVDQTDHCGIPDTNPYAIFDGVVEKIVEHIRQVKADFLALSPSDRASVQPELGDLTNWALQFSDDNVREQGIGLAEWGLPPDQRIPAVIASLEQSVSGLLVEEGMGVLIRTEPKGKPDQQTQDFMIMTLKSGGIAAAEAVARHALYFMNSQNRDLFVQAEMQAAPESNTRLFLKSDAQEFDRSQQGG